MNTEFHLCKIMNLEEHFPSVIGRVVNFSKSKYLYNLVAQLVQYQENPYNLQPVGKIGDLLQGRIYHLPAEEFLASQS
jgi:hypothetical protein